MKNKVQAAIYARKSVVLKKGDTLNMQDEKCRREIEHKFGYDNDIEIYSFFDQKSGKNFDREEMNKMIELIKASKINVVCTYKLDRLGRNATDLLNFIELLKKYRVILICVEDNITYDPTDDNNIMTKFLIMFLSMFAEMERNSIRQRVIDSRDYLSRLGFWLGGTAPYGFKTTQVINEGIIPEASAKKLYILQPVDEEVEIVQNVFEKYNNEHISYSVLAESIRSSTRFGRKVFDQHTVQDMLKNLSYVKATPEIYNYLIEEGCSPENISPIERFDGVHGILTNNKTDRQGDKCKDRPMSEWIVAIAPHMGIIEADIWLNVQRKMKERELSKDRTVSKHNNALMSGVKFTCKCCGGHMGYWNRKSNDGERFYHHYRCENKRKQKGKTCQVNNISGRQLDDSIENIIFEYIKKYVDISKVIKEEFKNKKTSSIKKSAITVLERECNKKERELKNTLDRIVDPKLSDLVIKKLNEQAELLVKEIDDLKKQIALELAKKEQMNKSETDLNQLYNRMLDFSKADFDTFDMNVKKSLVSEIIREVTWDGENVEVYFNIPAVLGVNSSSKLGLSGVTLVDSVKLRF